MDTGSFIVYIKTDNICKDIAKNVETRFDISNYELERPLWKGNNEEVIELIKDELVGKIMREIIGLRAKTHSCLIDDSSEDKKVKAKKKYVIKRKLKSEDYKIYLEATQLENKINHPEKNETNVDNSKKRS